MATGYGETKRRQGTPLTDEQLLAAISNEEQEAIGSLKDSIASDRADALNRYLGKPYGDEIAGRSSVVSRDVADVVEGVLANVLKPFVIGNKVAEFIPRNSDDEPRAAQETDYVNYVVLEKNNGFLVLNAAIKDALLLRNGYVRGEWVKKDDIVVETYEGMSGEELSILMDDESVEIFEHSEYPDPGYMTPLSEGPDQQQQMGLEGLPDEAMAQPPALHDVKLRRKTAMEYVELLPTPCDQMLIGKRTSGPSLQEADFVQFRVPRTLSYLRQQGYDIADDISDSDDPETLEEFARHRPSYDSTKFDDETGDPSRRIVLFKETLIRIDRDGDGIAELRKVCTVGMNILADVEADLVNTACFIGVLFPHEHLAISIYDMVQDIARLKTAVWRQYMDGLYLSNNGRTAVNFNTVTVDDLLVSRPGGVVRVDGDPGTALMPLQHVDTGASALKGLEYLDSVKENRSGYSNYSQGLDPDSIKQGPSIPLQQQLSQAQMRLEMVARTIAETGVRDLYQIVHALTLKHANKTQKFRLRDKWIEVDPREWCKRSDMTISVGLGVGSSEQMFQKLMTLLPVQQSAMQLGLATPVEMYNFGAELWKTAGFRNPDRFIKPPEIDPQTGQPKPPQQQPNPLVEAEQVKGQMQMQVKQIDAQIETQKMQMKQQMDTQQLQMQQQMAERKLMIEAQAMQQKAMAELQLQQSNDERQSQLDQQKFMLQMEADERKHQREQETELTKARISAEAQIAAATIKSRSIEQAQMQRTQPPPNMN